MHTDGMSPTQHALEVERGVNNDSENKLNGLGSEDSLVAQPLQDSRASNNALAFRDVGSNSDLRRVTSGVTLSARSFSVVSRRQHSSISQLAVQATSAITAATKLKDYEEVSQTVAETSLFCLSKRNPVRVAAVRLVTWKLFEHVMLLCILANCITLAMDSNAPGFEDTTLGKALATADNVFLAVFTVEAVAKIVAMGFVLVPTSYLRDPWNILDLVVITTGYLAFASFGNYTAIRGVRALRPLRTITKIEEMRALVVALLGALPMLGNVAVLALFYFAISGIATLQLFSGALSKRCGAPDFSSAVAVWSIDTGSTVVMEDSIIWNVPDDQSGDVCNGPTFSGVVWNVIANATNVTDSTGAQQYVPMQIQLDPDSVDTSPDGRQCDGPSDEYPYGLFCVPYGNPSGPLRNGFRDFDNFALALLASFQHITFTDYSYIMYDTQDGLSWWTWPLHLVMAVLGGYFLLNLTLAVMFMGFERSRSNAPGDEDAASDGDASHQGKDASHRGFPGPDSSNKPNPASPPPQPAPTAAAAAPSTAGASAGAQQQQQQVAKPDQPQTHGNIAVSTVRISTNSAPAAGRDTPEQHDEFVVFEFFEPGPDAPWHQHLRWRVQLITSSRGFELVNAGAILVNAVFLGLVWFRMPDGLNTAGTNINYAFTVWFTLELVLRVYGVGPRLFLNDKMNIWDSAVTVGCLVDMIFDILPMLASGPMSGTLTVLRLMRIFRLARFWHFLARIISIVMNSMGSVLYLTLLLVLFMFVAGLLGLQLFGYKLAFCTLVDGSYQVCPDGLSLDECPAHWDCYMDCTADQALTWISASGSPYGGQAYCERFPRSDEWLVQQGLDPATYSYTYQAQVGKPYVPRANYDDFFQAFFTIFQILTLDNWPDVMHATMASINPWAAIYYIVIIVIGTYMILNLFLAILLSGLDGLNEGDQKEEGSENEDDEDDDDEGPGAGTGPDKSRHVAGGSTISTRAAAGGGADGQRGTDMGLPASVRNGAAGGSMFGGMGRNKVAPCGSDSFGNELDSARISAGNGGPPRKQTSDKQGKSARIRFDDATLPGGGGSGSSLDPEDSYPGLHAPGAGEAYSNGHSASSAVMSREFDSTSSQFTPKPPHFGGDDSDGEGVKPVVGVKAPNGGSHQQALAAAPGQGWVGENAPSPDLVTAVLINNDAVDSTPTRPFGRSITAPTLRGSAPGSAWGAAVPQEQTSEGPEQRQGQQQWVAVDVAGENAGPALKVSMSSPGLARPPDVGGMDRSSVLSEPGYDHRLARGSQCFSDASAMTSASKVPEGQKNAWSGRLTSTGMAPLPSALPRKERRKLKQIVHVKEQARRSTAVHASAASITAARAATLAQQRAAVALAASHLEDLVSGPSRTAASSMIAGPRSQDAGDSVTESLFASRARPLPSLTAKLARGSSRSFAAQFAVKPTPQLEEVLLHGKSLGLFGPEHPLRRAILQVVASAWFEYSMLFLILASSVCLAVDSPQLAAEGNVQAQNALRTLDVVFAAVFCVEVLMKVVVLGLAFNGPRSFLRSGWNVLDALVAFACLATVVLEYTVMSRANHLLWIRGLRALRALRPLHAATRMIAIRVVVSAMLGVLPSLVKVLFVGLLFFFMFAVLLVNLLMGKMYMCADPGDKETALDPYYLVASGSINSTWCLQTPNYQPLSITTSYYHAPLNVTVPEWKQTTTWTAPLQRFDNVVQALWTLFQMASLEGWSDVAYRAADTVGIDEQPVRDANRYIEVLFLIFIIVGSFFMLNLVIGVTIDKFHQLKAKAGGKSVLMTPGQQQWLTIQRLMVSTKLLARYPPPEHRLRRAVHAVVTSQQFDLAMTAVIIANAVVLAMVQAGMSDGWSNAISAANAVFTGIFLAEMLAKWVGVGFKPYFTADTWNVFDCAVVAISLVGVITDYATSSNLTLLPLLRVLRVVRVFKLMRKATGLHIMLRTLLWSAPALVNVGSVLFLVMFVYAIAGMSLFGNIKLQSEFNRHANFENFPRAMLMLFRIMTGENWHTLMQQAMVQEQCVLLTQAYGDLPAGYWLDSEEDGQLISQLPDDFKENRCSPAPIVGILFFCSYAIIVTYLLVQLVVGVILDQIQVISYYESMAVGQSHIARFVEAWEELDPYATGYIHISALTTLLLAVPPPLGCEGEPNPRKQVQDIILTCDIPNRRSLVHFLETLHGLAGRVAGTSLPLEEEYLVHSRLIDRLPKDEEPPLHHVAHYYAAVQVSCAIRGFMARHRLQHLWKEQQEDATAAAAAAGGSNGEAPVDLPRHLDARQAAHLRMSMSMAREAFENVASGMEHQREAMEHQMQQVIKEQQQQQQHGSSGGLTPRLNGAGPLARDSPRSVAPPQLLLAKQLRNSIRQQAAAQQVPLASPAALDPIAEVPLVASGPGTPLRFQDRQLVSQPGLVSPMSLEVSPSLRASSLTVSRADDVSLSPMTVVSPVMPMLDSPMSVKKPAWLQLQQADADASGDVEPGTRAALPGAAAQ